MAELNSEPTMEEILSSIKKIIADDSGKSPVSLVTRRSEDSEVPRDHLVSIPMSNVVPEVRIDEEVPAATETSPPETDDVLELTEMAVEDATPHTPPTLAAVPTPAIAPVASVAEPAEAIVSPDASIASRNAFESLSTLVVKPQTPGSDTLEAMVRDMLRPMLKDWLDAKLPEIVEAMVAREIARISGR